jgi:hypothetical protein
VFSQRERKWSESSLSPQDAAVTSIALFGIALVRSGETPEQRLAGRMLQIAVIDYSKENPSARTACYACLDMWVKDHPSHFAGALDPQGLENWAREAQPEKPRLK